MTERIYLSLAKMSADCKEQEYITEAFDQNWVAPLGPNVNGFEQSLEGYLNRMLVSASGANGGLRDCGAEKYVAALSSGTAAVHLGLMGCGVGSGATGEGVDEVICQSLTFCASVNPVMYLGAKPVLVDSEEETWNMDPELMEMAIEDRIRKTGRVPKAIVPVHLYGMPAKMDRIMAIADAYGIPVMEDSAEAMGSKYGGRPCGSFGRYGVWSFNGNKMITTSGGGALICPDKESKQRAIFYATQAKVPTPYYQHEVMGFNYRMSNICAGIGRGQMTVLEEHIAHHRHVQQLYEGYFGDMDGIVVHRAPDGRFESNYWLCTILLDERLPVRGQGEAYRNAMSRTDCEPNTNVEALRLYLDGRGIESRPLWKPMHKHPLYRDVPKYENGVSEDLFRRGLCLPSGPCVTDEDVRLIVETIKEAIS